MSKKHLPLGSDFGTPEAAKKDGGLSIEPINRQNDGKVIQTRARRKTKDPLQYLHNRGSIDDAQYRMGMKFGALYYIYKKPPRMTIDLQALGIRGGDGHTESEKMLIVKHQIDEMCDVLKGEEFDALLHVCWLNLKPDSERMKRRLCEALRALDVWWRVKNKYKKIQKRS